jgi:argininosuccinate lyase
LQKVENEIESDEWTPDFNEFEDIHSAIEKRLTFHVGEIGGKLHTGRSRNDQVVTGVRLWQKNAILKLNEQIVSLQKKLIDLADQHINTIIPGYTHLQRAQPISFGFHLLAYVEMVLPKERFNNVFAKQISVRLLMGSTFLIENLPQRIRFTNYIMLLIQYPIVIS